MLHCSSWHYESRPLHHEIIDMHKWQWFRMRLWIRILLDIPVRHLQMTDVPVPAGVPKHDRQLFVSKAFFSTACALILELPFTLHHKNTQISRYLTEMPSPALPPSTIITLNKSLNSKPSMTIKCKLFFVFLSVLQVLSYRVGWCGLVASSESQKCYIHTVPFISFK